MPTSPQVIVILHFILTLFCGCLSQGAFLWDIVSRGPPCTNYVWDDLISPITWIMALQKEAMNLVGVFSSCECYVILDH